MSGWAIVALVGILVWGVVAIAYAKTGANGGRIEERNADLREDDAGQHELAAARAELADLKERIKVLERIATDTNTGEARERARIAAEIEALRDMPATDKE